MGAACEPRDGWGARLPHPDPGRPFTKGSQDPWSQQHLLPPPQAPNGAPLKHLLGAAASCALCLSHAAGGPRAGRSEPPAPRRLMSLRQQPSSRLSNYSLRLRSMCSGRPVPLPTAHHMICSDITAAADSPSTSPATQNELCIQPEPGLGFSRWHRVRNCCLVSHIVVFP